MPKDLSLYHQVGVITANLAGRVNFNFTGTVYATPGVIKHIAKHQGEFSPNVANNLLGTISLIISAPDYIGGQTGKNKTGIELIKKVDDNLLLGIDVDLKENYIYVASMYPVTDAKIQNRLNSNRLVKI